MPMSMHMDHLREHFHCRCSISHDRSFLIHDRSFIARCCPAFPEKQNQSISWLIRAATRISTGVPHLQENAPPEDPTAGLSYARLRIPFSRFLLRSSVQGGRHVIRKEAWSFYRTRSSVRLCWELEEPKGPKGCPGF